MTSTSTAYVTRTKVAAFTAVLAGLTLALSACGGGSKLDGEYYSSAGQLVIEGSTLNYTDFECSANAPALQGEVSATGQISDDGTQIIWASDDEHLENKSIGGTTSLTSAGSGDTKSIAIENHEFNTGDKDAALAGYGDNNC